MKIIMSGATGYLGNRLLAALSRQHDVYALVRDSSSLSGTCKQISNVHWIEQSLGQGLKYKCFPKHADVVIHVAQSRGYQNFPSGMEDMLNVNCRGIYELLEYARISGCSKFINTSTGSVYQSSDELQREEDQVWPESAYSVTKYCGELLTRPYESFYDILNLRLHFLYGPGQKGMLVSNLCDRIQAGRAIELQGAGGGLEFCPTYVDDVVRVIEESIGKAVKGVCNVATSQTLTMKDAALSIGALLGKTPVFERLVEEKACKFRPSLDRLRSWYDVDNGFRDFSEGIADTLRRE